MPGQDHITVRVAKPKDAAAASSVLIASITQLCHPDHDGDPEKIKAWTANKTPESVRGWIEDDRGRILIAEQGTDIAGVAGYSLTGTVILNYVAPAFRFRGVSDLLLARIEQGLIQTGLKQARLSSTVTAKQFYLARAWRLAGPVETVDGMPDQPMVKDLIA